MMSVLFVIVVGVAATAILVSRESSKPPTVSEVYKDYQDIREALLQYRLEQQTKEDDGTKGNNLSVQDLTPFLKNKTIVKKYAFSDDERYLIFKVDKNNFNVEELLSKVGGSSYLEGNEIYLSLVASQDPNRVPVAKITISPEPPIYTTTVLEFKASASITEGGVISDEMWVNARNHYATPGKHKVKLKVKDVNGRWSEYTETVIEVLEKEGVSTITSGYMNLFVLHQNGDVEGLGLNDYGQLGLATLIDQPDRKYLSAFNFIEEVAGGESHTVFRTFDGLVKSVGRNNQGQLGTGDLVDQKSPKSIWGLEGILQVDAGHDFSAALTSDGHVFAWGSNEHNQLGIDKSLFRDMPVEVQNMSNVIMIACGYDHMLALTTEGTIYGWGNNAFGQLGNGAMGKDMPPTMVETLDDIRAVRAGKNCSFAINSRGEVYAFGLNSKCQLGQLNEKHVEVPRLIPGLTGIIDLRTKGNFVVALDENGQVHTWGQYGMMDSNIIVSPIRMDLPKRIKGIATTQSNGFALAEDDSVYRWSLRLNDFELLKADPEVHI